MWLFTLHGFFSATRSRTEPDKIQLRARAEKDMRALRKAHALEDRKIIVTPGSDYICRIILTPEEFIQLAARLAAEIVYFNFKDAVHRQPGQEDKSGPYMSVWSTMNQYQNRVLNPRPVQTFKSPYDRDDNIFRTYDSHGQRSLFSPPEAFDHESEPRNLIEFEDDDQDRGAQPAHKIENSSVLRHLREAYTFGVIPAQTVTEICEALYGHAGKRMGQVFRTLYRLQDRQLVRKVGEDKFEATPGEWLDQ